VSEGIKTLELRYRVAGVRNELAQKYVLIGIEPFFDYREDMLGFDRDTALFHFF
jgi:hypothetical protein